MDVLITAVAVVIILAIVYWYGVKTYSLISDVPINGPKPWPYIGNIPDIIQNGGLHKTLWSYFKQYGRVHKLYIGRSPAIVVSDPEIVKVILVKEFDKFRNRPRFIKFNPPMTYVLAATQDESWKRIRTIMTPTFSAAKLRQINPIIGECMDILQSKLEHYSETGEDVNITRIFARFALDVIMKAAFGYDIDVQNQPNDEFLILANNAFRIPLWKRAFSAVPFSDLMCDIFNVEFLANVDYFFQIAMKIIGSRKEQGVPARRDFLQLLLEANDAQVDGKSKLSDIEVAAQSMQFLLAGFETTSTTLACTSYYMASNPGIQETLQEELDRARKENPDASMYDLVHHIEYLDKVVCEVLRLCTPGFNLVRACNQDVTIKGIRFPKGVDVNIPNYCLHRDPEAWERPDEFYPEHFSAQAKEKRHAYSYMPFGLGPRQCIGMRLALNEVKSALFLVNKNFKFERCPKTVDLEYKATLLMLPKDDVYLRVIKR